MSNILKQYRVAGEDKNVRVINSNSMIKQIFADSISRPADSYTGISSDAQSSLEKTKSLSPDTQESGFNDGINAAVVTEIDVSAEKERLLEEAKLEADSILDKAKAEASRLLDEAKQRAQILYQKLILRFGQPETIKVNGKKPRVVFFVGPTGVGKTTTIAKIASKFKVNYNKNIAFITADTYRIAATDQLRTFANILDTPLSVIYTATELNSAVAEYEQADVIFVDTAGFSHKNETQRNDMRALLAGLSPEYEKSVYLVLSATTKYRDLISIIDSYKDIDDYKLIFTKLDETSSYGNLLNIKLYSDAGISYVTNGQNVPDDIEVFDTQKIVKQLLGGRQ